MEAIRPIGSLAIVTPFYPPHVGGVERYAQQFARAAADLGLTVNVVTTDAIRRPAEHTDDRGVRVLRLPAYNLPVMGSTYPISLSGWHRAAELLRCDAVMAHTRFFMTTPIAAVLAARQRGRVFVVDHGSGPLRSSPRLLMAALLAYEHVTTAALKRLPLKFFAVSAASSNWLRRFGISDARVLPNGVVPRKSMPIRKPVSFGDPVILFAGRLIPEKGVRELVEAVEMLVRSGSRLRLRIAGAGPLSGFLKKRASASDAIIFLGSITTEQMAAEMDAATLFINPSNYAEGLPTTLLEAGSAALPVISTAQGGSVDLVRDGSTGWIISRGETREITRALHNLMARPTEAIRRGANLFNLVQENYTWPMIVRSFLRYAAAEADA